MKNIINFFYLFYVCKEYYSLGNNGYSLYLHETNKKFIYTGTTYPCHNNKQFMILQGKGNDIRYYLIKKKEFYIK